MADVKALKKLNRDQLNEFAVANGIADAADESKYPDKGALATELSPKVTPEDLTAFIAGQKSGDEEPTPPADAPTPDGPTAPPTPDDSNELPPVDPTADPNRSPEAGIGAKLDEPAEDDTSIDPAPAKGTRVVYVRLVKSYEHPRGHRRAGIAFTAGPTPQRLELTKEQIETIESDPVMEIVTKKEAEKWGLAGTPELTDVQSGDTPEQQNPANLAGEADTGTTPQHRARRYNTDPTRQDSPEFDGVSQALEETLTGDEAGSTTDAPASLSTDMKLAELQGIATSEGVADADKLRTKQSVIDAIETNRSKE